MGRQLATMSGNGYNISYKYNDAGIRTEKTVNGVVTKYHLLGAKVTYETNGTDSIYYTYDANGKLISMNLNGTEYYYIRNGQSDIIGLFDSVGDQVVSYTYDTWGKLVSITGSLANTVGVNNPYRYRGYRYDTESGLYYLNSRYYNPEWGRFINADSNLGNPGELLTHNVFAYCANNPVMYEDQSGHFFMLITGLVGAAVGGIVAAATGKNVLAGMAIGGAIGLTGGAGAAYIAAGSAFASTSAVMTGFGIGATGGGTIVIGETMRRVVSYADSIGAEVYKGFKFYDKVKDVFGTRVANLIGGIDNAVWIMDKMVKQYKIVDIGIDATRATSSPYYYMESILTFFYNNKQLVEEFFK